MFFHKQATETHTKFVQAQFFLHKNLLHDVSRSAMVLKLTFHKVHIRLHMLKKLTVALAQIIKAIVAILVVKETILRTLSMTGKQEFAFFALLRQHLLLHLCKLVLLIRIHHLRDGLCVQIAEKMLRKIGRAHV